MSCTRDFTHRTIRPCMSERTTKRFEQYSNGETALVLNYAGIEPERLSETVRRLACVFPECE